MKNPDADYYTRQFNARLLVPEHPIIFTRWKKDSLRVRRTSAGLFDLAYGEAPGERLDFFPARGSAAPLLVFIHGGWWRSLDKSDFSFIAPAYTAAGFNVALTNYTLAPHASLADIVREQLRAIAWLYRHAEQYDFDPNRIVVAGHSAGGHLGAMLMAAHWPVFGADLPRDLIKGAVLLSGIFDLEPVRHAGFVNDDLKLTESDVGMLSPAWLPQAHPTPFVTAYGALESDEFRLQTELIGRQWKSTLQAELALPGLNHLTVCDAFGDAGHALHRATLDLLRR